MAYTLGLAAKATGRSKATISKAIATHRISATKNELGEWQIDPSELHRVYPPLSSPLNDTVPLRTPEQTAENERLKATVDGLERLCRQIEGERDSLREQNTRLTALLTDQRGKAPDVIVTTPPPAPPAEAKAPAGMKPPTPKRKGWFGWRRG
jgi:hypothetical protein